MRGSAWPAFSLAVRIAGAELWASWEMCLGGTTAFAHSGPCSVALRPPVPSSCQGTCRRSWRVCASSDHPQDWMVLGRPSVLGGRTGRIQPCQCEHVACKTVSSSSAAGRVVLQARKAVGALGLLLNYPHPSCIITSSPLIEHLPCACHRVRYCGDYCSYYFTS